VALATAAVLLVWSLYRICAVAIPLSWWLLPVTVAGMIAADLLSGLVHWTADTWGSESMPVIGRRLLHPFRVHHVNPDDFLRRRFIDTNGDVAMLVIPILAMALLLPLGNQGGLAAAVFLAAFSGVGLLTNQVHQWAHMPRPPALVRFLQDWRVILSREEHARHHRPPYAAYYCIATGWCNRPLAGIDFFKRLERTVTRLTGLSPRQDDAVFQDVAARASGLAHRMEASDGG
jgi:hypothetical protein